MTADTATAAARTLVAHRKRVPATCERCGTAFTGYAKARYCGSACRYAAWLAKQPMGKRMRKKQEPARIEAANSEPRRVTVEDRTGSSAREPVVNG